MPTRMRPSPSSRRVRPVAGRESDSDAARATRTPMFYVLPCNPTYQSSASIFCPPRTRHPSGTVPHAALAVGASDTRPTPAQKRERDRLSRVPPRLSRILPPLSRPSRSRARARSRGRVYPRRGHTRPPARADVMFCPNPARGPSAGADSDKDSDRPGPPARADVRVCPAAPRPGQDSDRPGRSPGW